MAQKIKDKYLYIPIIVLLFFFIYEIIQYYQIISLYPIRVVGDLNTYTMNLHLLAKYGFHNFVPYIYNGMITLRTYPPGWAFFTLPLLHLFKDILLTSFISLMLILILSLFAIYLICRINKYSTTKTVAFYLFFFANPFMLDSIFHIGRTSEAFGWMIFLWFFVLISYYRERKLDLKFMILLTIGYSALILSHIYLLVIGSIIICSFLLTKLNKEMIKIIIPIILGLIITSFWWIPFSEAISVRNHIWSIQAETNSNLIESFFSYNTISIIIFSAVILFYILSNKENRDLKFLLPIITLALLIITRIITFIPVLRDLPFNIYTSFFVFISIFYFFKINLSELNKFNRKFIHILIIILPFILGLLLFGKYYDFTVEYRPPEFRGNSDFKGISAYEITELDENVFEVLRKIDKDNYFLILSNSKDYKLSGIYSSYGMINYGIMPILITQNPIDIVNQSNYDEVGKMYLDFDNEDCIGITNKSKILKIKQIVSYKEGCALFKRCGFDVIMENKQACLLNIS